MKKQTLALVTSVAATVGFAAVVVSNAADKPLPTEKITPDQLAFFEKRIRPVLVAKCYKCHSAEAEKVKGGLLVDTRDGIRMGGATGHAIEPGDLKGSLLIAAIRGEKKDLLMPPKEKLPPEIIADFEKWVLMGAPDPRDGKAKLAKKPDAAEGKNFWAFQPVKPVAAPQPKDAKWSATDIDRFVLKKLEESNLKPVADADPHTLIRRLYFDLVGLPPTPAEVDAFVKDCAASGNSALRIPNSALEKVVDRLLASPRFGERWGRHWLDVARYAESSGKERNYLYTQAWRYRDYVIDSINADKPYDQFIREQVAGDLLPAKTAAERNQLLIATGFLAMGPKSFNERNREQFVMDNVDEQIDVTTRAVMAVTVSCARCHDHKFDPIAQRDYYAVAGIFKSTDIYYGTGDGTAGKNRQPGQLLPMAKDGSFKEVKPAAPQSKPAASTVAPAATAPANGDIETRLARLAANNPKIAERLKTMTPEQKAAAIERLQANASAGVPAKAAKAGKAAKRLLKQPESPGERPELGDGERVIMGVIDGRVADCPIYVRGELDEKGPVIPRGFVPALNAGREMPALPSNQSGRLQFAEWLTSAENPLTARVLANRVWQHLFGDGIVASADNFGATGDRPTHPELLDFLAGRLMANQWSLKKLIREVALSRTYRLSAAHDAKNFAADPDNNLLWRANQRRLDAESIRDAVLAVGGRLDLTPPRSSPVTALGDTDIGRSRNVLLKTDSLKRSVYLPIVRDMVPEVLDLFDFAEPSLVVANRDVTTVPSQALFMLNSAFVQDSSAALAKLVQSAATDSHARITHTYLATLSRQPSVAEVTRAEAYLKKLSSESGCTPDTAWATFCQALLASAEFRYVR
jgi:cytochrome c553